MKFTIYNLRFTPRTSRREEALTSGRCRCYSRFTRRTTNVVQSVQGSTEPNPFQRFNISTLLPRRSVAKAGQRAFTLIEMLTVIAIIGIIAGLSVPVIKNFGTSNVTVSASRQLRDDVGRARQLAMSERTTVYMVFLPTNFWNVGGFPNTWYNDLTPPQKTAFSNLLDKQLSGYTYMAQGAVGDQPTVGQKTWHYLAPWQSLPAGSFIPTWKFSYVGIPGQPLRFSDPANGNYTFNIYPFSYTNTFPVPTEDSTNPAYAGNLHPNLPYIAFNYLGQLSDYSGNMLSPPQGKGFVADDSQRQDYDLDFAGGGVDIPLAQGSVIPTKDPNSRAPVPMAAGVIATPGVIEMPPGNSTNISYTVVHIDPLTGRATLEYHKMQ